MNAGPSGFQNAPITKGVVVVCGLATLLVGTSRRSIIKACGLSYQAVVQNIQLWRLGTATCVFSSTPELVFGLYLIYFFRVFERQIGSNKYSVFVLTTTIISTLLELSVLAFFRDPTTSGISLAPGPYGLIFASFVPYFFDIPISTRFRVFRMQFSDKTFVYLAGLQLLLSSWRQSLIPGLCGVLAGFTYRSNIFGIRRLKFPKCVASFFSRIFSPLLLSWPSPAPRGLREPSRRLVEGPFVPPQAPARAAAPPPPPPEESIATLVSMGFDRGLAIQALSQARNDMVAATNILLEQSH
ncbi:hypothetical protein SELMODRAFT_140411 [Selaginella moellendorffii]|uniref:UBA domain-containing protein n=1 Tax=Selaginella moellendorffii TaxID=88036 RepID=D8QTV1_SELML|nr:rhomboid-like protein 20 isoform X2 [Selaginella moellendorffii]EFJ37178.1 hypothetical protein SELMODRAFT_140411 [Selaginella moellendorffii]|eukprot:XP_002961918.1 rhomboid-like protein 20 isoform X2 [Selaginella moellendorffii]